MEIQLENDTHTEKGKFVTYIEKHKETWKFLKFLFTGASTSVLQLSVQMFLLYVVFTAPIFSEPVTNSPLLEFLGIGYWGYVYSYFISAVIGYAAAYIMNRKITFKSDADPLVSTILYTIMVICTITFTTWLGSFLGTLLIEHGWKNIWTDMLLSLFTMTVPTVWTYPLSRFVIHKKKK